MSTEDSRAESAPAAGAAASVSAGSTVEEDVRRLYAEANRNPNSIAALTHGRRAAEAVCQALGERLPAKLRDRFRGQQLHSQISLLEDQVTAGVVPDVPRHVLAGLRTLQAYGNYAAHYEQGVHVPPIPATESAFASLALVVHWFLGKLNPIDAPERASLAAVLRVPAPEQPDFVTRWRLRHRVGKPPSLDTRDVTTEMTPHKFTLEEKTEDDEAKLLVLRGYYGASKVYLAKVCRVVLSRETTLETDKLGLDELILRMFQLSQERPVRIPRSTAADLEEFRRRAEAVQRTLAQDGLETATFVSELRHRDLTETLHEWFEKEYLELGTVERNWKKIFIGIPLLLWIWNGQCDSVKSDAAAQATDDFKRKTFIQNCTGQDAGSASACRALRPDGFDGGS